MISRTTQEETVILLNLLLEGSRLLWLVVILILLDLALAT
jgi:hypothetical protein